MGLEIVELIMEVEDRFKVSLPDDGLFHMETLGHMHDYLLEKCAGREASSCPVGSAFYRLRRAMVEAFGLDRQALRPSTDILPLLGSWRLRARNWRRLEKHLKLRLPPLANRSDAGVYWGAGLGVAGGIVFGFVTNGGLGSAFGGGVVGLPIGMLLGFAVGSLCVKTVPEPYRTLSGLSKAIIGGNYWAFSPPEQPPTEGDPIWEELSGIVAEQFAVPRETLRRSTRFVQDLGC